MVDMVRPEIDGGRYPIKRVVGESVTAEAAIFADGHDQISCKLLYRHESEDEWRAAPMEPLGNDLWRGQFRVGKLGKYFYTVEGWVDHFQSWRAALIKKTAASQDVSLDLQIGAGLIRSLAEGANGNDAAQLRHWAEEITANGDRARAVAAALSDDLASVADRNADRHLASRFPRELAVQVDRERARFSTWYEVFPRSCSNEPGTHGTFRDCEQRLPYIQSLGFDVVYLPPVHPIGRDHRKGKNNSVACAPGDVGSPWAIGAPEGGHSAVHPQLGTLDDFRRLVAKAREMNMEIALDIAFQCSPDHPYTQEHPEWFRHRPDGSIQYAENPPKKYEDIYPLDFETEHWRELWQELKSVLDFWIFQGVRIFRVDNPHTKAFSFWEWVIAEIKREHPETLFLAEAFTRPHLMYGLAKLGFSQSYTYFTWRNTRDEITAYLTELTQTDVREFFRANLWPNTPDILAQALVDGGRAGFMIRLLLAATLGANYGIYGPAFELCERERKESGSEEYLNSEKYEIKHWNLDAPHSLKDFIAQVNAIRRQNAALQTDRTLRFHATDNPMLICYSKTAPGASKSDASLPIVAVVNLDPFYTQSGWVSLDLGALGLDWNRAFQAQDLLGGQRYLWQGSRNYVELAPERRPAHILRLRQ